jgi:hypothetical protein
MSPVSGTSSDLVHKIHGLSTFCFPKILKSQISSYLDHKKSSVPNVSRFGHFQWPGPQTWWTAHILFPQDSQIQNFNSFGP